MTMRNAMTIFVRMLENGLIFVREIVTHSPFGQDELRLGRVPFDLFAQAR